MFKPLLFDFPDKESWLNAPPLSLKQELKNKILVIDFWTYCCINCLHVLPDLKFLEEKYRQEAVAFIGVHSPKFPNERQMDNVRHAILRYDITHPVVNDPSFSLWKRLGVHAWPTIAVLGLQGELSALFSGEGHREEIDKSIQKGLERYRKELDPTPVPLCLEKEKLKAHTPLLFPGKVCVDQKERVFVSDSGHHRIVVVNGKEAEVIGEGVAGLQDGPFQQARFNHPQGLVMFEEKLYVADTQNHAIRQIDFISKTVSTLVGDGGQGGDRRGGKFGRLQRLNSPWDIVAYGSLLLIAMAGMHQIWQLDLQRKSCQPLIGSGAELNLNGPSFRKVALAQPSGLCLAGPLLYIADSESSTIRCADLASQELFGLVGGEDDSPSNLFAYGDQDGIGQEARLQHPLAVEWLSQIKKVVVADSYNHRLKLLDPLQRSIVSWVGEGQAGYQDGSFSTARFWEPSGLTWQKQQQRLYVADTNNHRLRFVDLVRKQVDTFTFQLG